MPFITFIYRIGNNRKHFYGKYVCDEMSDDHDGLDNEIMPVLIDGINKYRKQRGLSDKKISLGILSFSANGCIPTFSTDNEIKCFDFYHKEFIYRENETYVNGRLINRE